MKLLIIFFKRNVFLGAVVMLLTACQTTSGGSSGAPSSKTPVPSGGQSGEASPSAIPGSKPESQAGSEPGSGAESTVESGKKNSDSSAIPPEWEQEETDLDSDSSAENGGDDVSFEEPSFEQVEGLSDKELEELESELDESLGDFDEQMQREQTYAEERANENTGEDALGGIGIFEDYDGDESDAEQQASVSEGQAVGSQSSAGESGDVENSRQGSDPVEQQVDGETTDILDDIPSGNDDDIVARQIREAAEKETDPVLREKLWDEYRRYKNQ